MTFPVKEEYWHRIFFKIKICVQDLSPILAIIIIALCLLAAVPQALYFRGIYYIQKKLDKIYRINTKCTKTYLTMPRLETTYY